MLALIITGCLATHPGVCRTWEIPLTLPKASQGMCQMVGQLEMAKPGGWQDQNRGWMVKDYKCAEIVQFTPRSRAEGI